jgi:hypothetical protein
MEFKTNRGENLGEIAQNERVMLVFLRHFGCTFCRETMSDLAARRRELEARGIRIVVVHMVSTEVADNILNLYELDGLSHISDVHQKLYQQFGLKKTTVKSLMGLPNWWRALVAGVFKGHLIGKPAGDPFQMPGIFVFHKNKILNKFTYRYVSDRPDFTKIAQVA